MEGNAKLIAMFKELKDFYPCSEEASRGPLGFKVLACSKIISKLEGMTKDLEPEDLDEPGAVRKLFGKRVAGPGTVEKMEQAVFEGKIEKLERYRGNAKMCALRELSSVWAVGVTTAKKLYQGCAETMKNDTFRQHFLDARRGAANRFHLVQS